MALNSVFNFLRVVKMNKTLIAVAVAAILAPLASHAESPTTTTLYGRVDARVTLAEDSDIDQNNGALRIGVKTSHDFGTGMSGFAKVETNISLDGDGDDEAKSSTLSGGRLGIRHAHAGLKGGFGTFTIGRQGAPYSDIYKADLFTSFSGASEQGSWRMGKALGYASPDLGGFSVSIAGALDGEGSTEDGGAGEGSKAVNMISAVAKFGVGPVSAALGIENKDYERDIDSGGKSSLVGLGLDFTSGPIQVAFHGESQSEGSEETAIDLAVVFTVSDATSIGASYAAVEEGAGAEGDWNRVLVGVYHNIGKSTNTFLAAQSKGGDQDGTDIAAGLKVTW